MELREKINPKHTALIVIDVQKDFMAPDGLLGKRGRDLSMMDPMVDRLEKTIKVASQTDVLALYTQQIYEHEKLNELQKEQYELDGKLVTCDSIGDGYKFYRINPPSNAIYVKHNYNVFSNPDFIKTLEAHKIKTLVITGVDTYICVETAIRNGFDLGYKIVVPKDLVATNGRHKDAHERTLWLVQKTYGALTTSEEIATIWGEYAIESLTNA